MTVSAKFRDKDSLLGSEIPFPEVGWESQNWLVSVSDRFGVPDVDSFMCTAGGRCFGLLVKEPLEFLGT